MSRMLGTVSMGVRAPIIRQGDDLAQIVTNAILDAIKEDSLIPRDRDIVAMTESIVARSQGNYCSVDDIAADVHTKFGGETVGVIFPILSRNRFSICLRGIAKGCKKVILMLSYPSDEVGNHLIDWDSIDAKNVNPYSDVLTAAQFRELFGEATHPFTGVDYIAYYTQLIQDCGAEAEIILANNPRAILPYTKNVLTCDIHTRERTKRILREAGAEIVYGMDDIMREPVNGSGYNARYGLLGSNKSTEDTIKLFPRECQDLVEDIQQRLLDATGKKTEFLRMMCEEMGVSGGEPLQGRAEELGHDPARRERYDAVLSRAVASMDKLDELCLPLCRVGGVFLALKSAAGREECEKAASGLAKLGASAPEFFPYQLPGDQPESLAVRIRKCKPTPAAYPRAFGAIKKRPL